MDPEVDETIGTLAQLWDRTLSFLPRIGIALAVTLVFWIVARLVAWSVHRATARRDTAQLALAMARLVKALVIVAGFFFAATVAFPTFTPGDLVTTLGIGGVAIGIVFKDPLENFFSGVLILVTKPFLVGDQIRYGDFEGTVEAIETRATLLTTYDGRRVVLPNGELFNGVVTVNTAFSCRRSEYDVGIGYGDDLEVARGIMLDVLRHTEGVLAEPAPEVLVVALAESAVSLRARWWSASRIKETLYVQDRVLSAFKRRLHEAGVDLPFPTRQILFHDQTEATDGDRRRQREGWPAGDGDVPAPRRPAEPGAAHFAGAPEESARSSSG